MEALSTGSLKKILIWAAVVAVICGAGFKIRDFIKARELEKDFRDVVIWHIFYPEDHRFTVQFPAKPEQGSRSFVTPQGRINVMMYASGSDEAEYLVASNDFPPGALTGKTTNRVLDNERDRLLKLLHAGLINEITVFSKGQYQGRQITVKLKTNRVVTCQIILKDDRIYHLLMTARGEKPLEQERERFFDSFAILR